MASPFSNCGGVDPDATARMVRDVAREYGLPAVRVAAVTGDDVSAIIVGIDPVLAETGEALSRLGAPVIAANAYLGASAIAGAYAAGAEVIVTGRVTDWPWRLAP